MTTPRPLLSPASEGPPATRLHVAVVTETWPPEVNGVALTLARLVLGLGERGHAVSLVRPRQAAAGAGASARSASDGGADSVAEVAGMPIPQYPHLRMGLPAGALLRRLWTARRPDVVHVATEGPLGFSAVRTATRLR